MSVIALRPKCRFCGKHKHPREFVGGTAVGYCLDCLAWHRRALDMLVTGEMPSACQGCGRTPEQLAHSTGSVDVQFALHRKDGIYQILCVPFCDANYMSKRRDQFGATPAGAKAA